MLRLLTAILSGNLVPETSKCECPCGCEEPGTTGNRGFDDDVLCVPCYQDAREAQVSLAVKLGESAYL